MPVLVTGADRPVARRLVRRLLDEGGEVRAHTAEAVADLRAAGALVASGTWDDEGHLEAALTDVHTVVHLGAHLLTTDPDLVVDEAEVLARAAGNAGVRRILMGSLPGASPEAADPLRRACGTAERLLAAAPPPTITVRVSLVDTPEVRDALATAGLDEEARAVEVAPVRSADLVELLVAFDRARSRAAHGHLVIAADGPKRMPVTTYLEQVGVAPPGRGGLVGRRLADDRARDALTATLRGGPWWSEDPAVVDGWEFAQVVPVAPGG